MIVKTKNKVNFTAISHSNSNLCIMFILREKIKKQLTF